MPQVKATWRSKKPEKTVEVVVRNRIDGVQPPTTSCWESRLNRPGFSNMLQLFLKCKIILVFFVFFEVAVNTQAPRWSRWPTPTWVLKPSGPDCDSTCSSTSSLGCTKASEKEHMGKMRLRKLSFKPEWFSLKHMTCAIVWRILSNRSMRYVVHYKGEHFYTSFWESTKVVALVPC